MGIEKPRRKPFLRFGLPFAAAALLLPGIVMRPAHSSAGTSPTYSIDFHAITAGGSALRSDCYRLSGAIGQAAPGYSSGSTYSLVAGFWSVETVTASDEIFFNGFQGC